MEAGKSVDVGLKEELKVNFSRADKAKIRQNIKVLFDAIKNG